MQFRVTKALQCTRSIVYEVEAADEEEAEDMIRADNGALDKHIVADTTELNADPMDKITAEKE